MTWLRLPLFITVLFALLVAVPFEGAGSRGSGLAAVAYAIRRWFVEPMTLPGAILFVFAVTGFFSFVMGRGAQSFADKDEDARRPVPNRSSVAPLEPLMPAAAGAERKSFGKKVESQSREYKAMGELAENAKRLLRNRGLDWFISEHGYEGRWQMAVRELREAGDLELADKLEAGGEIYERWMAIQNARDDFELSQDQCHAYFDELRPIEMRIWALLKE